MINILYSLTAERNGNNATTIKPYYIMKYSEHRTYNATVTDEAGHTIETITGETINSILKIARNYLLEGGYSVEITEN